MHRLTPRELELARLVALGESNKHISELLGISQQTVRNHVRSIFKKLSVRNRVQLTLRLSKQLDEVGPDKAPAQESRPSHC
jgi:DNA-binding NarL/FixJ family response regulator